MKLKRILAGVLTGAMVITGIPVFGTSAVSAAPVTAGSTLNNVAQGKTVTVSTYESGTLYDGSKIVDGIDTVSAESGNESMWRSGQLVKELTDGTTEKNDQWATIDLEAVRTAVEEIEVTFYNDKNEWATNYEVQTSANGREWTKLATVTHTSNANPLSEPDRITRMDTDNVDREEGAKIVLQRYVRFYFTGVNSYAESKRVSVAEIRIYGEEAKTIPAPSVEFTAPSENQYPQLADVKADESSTDARHQNLADRTTPASTLLKASADVTPDGEGNINVTQDMLFESDADFDIEENEDGIWGFNAKAKTVGIQNKFNADGNYVKIISFKLYMKKMSDKGDLWQSGGGRTIYSKGDKYMMQADTQCLKISMKNSSNQWPSEYYEFSNEEKTEGNENYFFQKWHDILVVIDGQGKQRLYVDGKPGKSVDENRPAVHPDTNTATPFGLFCDATDINNEDKWFTSDFGYIAQFKFYSNQSYQNIVNGAGTDITDAAVLDLEVAQKINITELESKYGNRVYGEVSDVSCVVNNLLQTQRPTVRFTLCPYDRATVWSKWVAGEGSEAGSWQTMAEDERFAAASTNTKYSVTTTLTADDGFVFDQNCRDNVEITVAEGSEEPTHTVVNLSDNDRILTITAYYNCEDDDEAIPGTCQLEDLILDSDEIIIDIKDGTSTIPTPETVISKCAKHEGSTAKITYAVTEGEEYISVDENTGVITANKKSKVKMGYAPVTIQVKAVLKDKDGQDIKDTVDGVTELTREISVHVHETKEDQTINTAPTISTKVPQTGSYPEIADVKMIYPEGTNMASVAQYDDIEDRMQPNATLNQTTVEYMNANIAKLIQAREGVSNDEKGKIFGLNAQPDDLPAAFDEPIIENTEGVWGFVGQGQTPGTENKFDVYGDDVKMISFKLYLKQWPNTIDPTRPNQNKYLSMSIFGKGDKYAVQLTHDRQFVMYMENTNKQWPQEIYTAPALENGVDTFLNTWHDVFMVVDGKGKQRIYVDGVPSTTDRNFTALAKEDPSHGRQSFTIGYNLSDTNGTGDNQGNWWRQMFTKEYGYIADFEFYTDKNYYGVINGAGTNISDANVLSAADAAFIDIAKLEATYGTTGNIKTVLLNVLQQNNATAAITVTPYAAKTIWKEVKEGSDPVTLNPKNPIMGEASYISETTLTAYDGFKFSKESSFTDAVKANFSTDAADKLEGEPVVNVSKDGKVLTVTATYAKTAAAECTCAINSFATSAITIECEKGETDKKDNTLANFTVTKVPCAVAAHQEDSDNTRVDVSAAIKGETDVIELNADTKEITAKKIGTATITVTAKFQIKGDDGTYTTVTNKDGAEVIKTEDITVNVVRKNAADAAYKADLIALIPADGAYVEEDYEAGAWTAYSTALAEAKRIKDETDVTKSEVDAAKGALETAIEAMPDNKSAVGNKKEEVKAAINNADTKAIYDAGNDNGVYTTETWSVFKSAYEDARTASTGTGKTVDELGALIKALEDAEKGLLKVADMPAGDAYKQDLKDLIPEDNTYLAEDYDANAMTELQDKIDAANTVINDADATKGQVDEALAELQAAIAGLASAKSPVRIAKDALLAAVEAAKEIYPSKEDVYTEDSWKIFEDAYKAADLTEVQMKGMSAADLTALKEALEKAQNEQLVEKTTDSGENPDDKDPVVPTVKDGDPLTGADGTKYQVASAKDKTVIITKGIDVRTVKVGPTVVIDKETYKVIGIGNSAFKGLKKATKVVINANVATIGDQAFANSKKLKNVTIGANVVKIGKKAFFKCTKLNKVILKGTALTNKSFGKQAFKKTAAKATVKWGKVKGKARTKLKKAIKKAGLKVK